MLYCVHFNGILLEVLEENGIILKTQIKHKCESARNKVLEDAILSFGRGNKDIIKYYLDANENLKIIYRKALEIPFGKVISYGGLSKAIFGNTHHSRFVGYAMHVNPLPAIVPCHRVIMSNGKIGGFSSNVQNKIKMLEAEGIKIENDRIASLYFANL